MPTNSVCPHPPLLRNVNPEIKEEEAEGVVWMQGRRKAGGLKGMKAELVAQCPICSNGPAATELVGVGRESLARAGWEVVFPCFPLTQTYQKVLD